MFRFISTHYGSCTCHVTALETLHTRALSTLLRVDQGGEVVERLREGVHVRRVRLLSRDDRLGLAAHADRQLRRRERFFDVELAQVAELPERHGLEGLLDLLAELVDADVDVPWRKCPPPSVRQPTTARFAEPLQPTTARFAEPLQPTTARFAEPLQPTTARFAEPLQCHAPYDRYQYVTVLEECPLSAYAVVTRWLHGGYTVPVRYGT